MAARQDSISKTNRKKCGVSSSPTKRQHKFVVERDHIGGFNVYDIGPSGLGRGQHGQSKVAWVSDDYAELFEKLLNAS